MSEVGSVSRGRVLSWALAVLVGGLLAHLPGLGGAFVYDDLVTIVGNPHFTPLWPPSEALWAVPDSGLAGRPVVSFSFALDHALGGFDPHGYHVTNLVAHLAAALLLFGVVRRTLSTPALAPRFGAAAAGLAGAAALLWAVHPLTTSAVTYVYQRSEVAMMLCLLLTLYGAQRSWSGGRSWVVLSIAACWLGVGSKETMVAAPVLVLAHDALFGAGSVGAALARRRGLYAGLFASWVGLAALVVHSGAHGTSVGFAGAIGAWEYLRTQAVAIVLYLKLSVWPQPLVFDYGWPVPESAVRWATAGACVLALFAATLGALRRRRASGFLGLWFFAILGPTSSVLPIVTELVVEHRMYAPLAAVTVLVVCGVWALLDRVGVRGPAVLGVGLLAAAPLVVLTRARGAEYADPELLWSESLRHAPGNARAHYVLGEFAREGGRVGEAQAHYRQAVELQPDDPFWRLNPGVLALEQGDLDLALEMLEAAVRLRPAWTVAHYNLGLARKADGDLSGAVASFETALGQSPTYLEALVELADAHARGGDFQQASAWIERALSIAPPRHTAELMRRREAYAAGRLPGETGAPGN